VRYLTLTHNGGPVWADPALEYDGAWVEHPKVGGLSPFGVEVSTFFGKDRERSELVLVQNFVGAIMFLFCFFFFFSSFARKRLCTR
jgi:hypothetical protein